MKYKTICTVLNRQASNILRTLLLAAFVGMLVGFGFYSLSAKTEKALALSKFIGGIITRSADLNYITEQDSEIFSFYRNAAVSETSEDAFLGLLRRPPESPIIHQSWSAFFQIRTQNDPTGHWRHLQEYLEAHLTDRAIFRIPRDPPYDAQYDLYAIGLFNGETVVGIQMFGVAT